MLETTVGRYTVSYCRIVREPLARVGEINSLWLHDSSLDFQRATCIVSIKKYVKTEALTSKLVSALPSLYYVLLSKIAVIFRDDFCNPESLLFMKGTCTVLSTQPLTEISTVDISFGGGAFLC
jgi:hypothetical protein